MGRKKRSEKLAQAVAVKPAPAPEVRVAERVIAALCPVCGRTVPEKRAIKAGYITYDHIPYFDSIEWDKDKPFGVSRLAAGRGSFSNWEYINPQDAPELFEAVKGRFIQALEEWLNKKWIAPEEIKHLLEL